MNLLVALFLILCEAIYEGLADRGHKLIAGIIEFVYRTFVTLAIFALFSGIKLFENNYPDYWYIVTGFVLVRFALFDLTYNLIRQNPVFYIGDTKLYDKILGWFFRWSGIDSGHFLAMVKLIALLIGLTWLIRY